MAEKNVNVRLVATGGGQVRAELAGIGEAGDDAFAKVGAGATAASGKLRAVGGAAEQAGRGAANAANGGLRQTTMQLSQVAQQASATGNWVQAFAIQLPDLALAFGPVGIAVGAVAGALLTLAPSLLGAGDAAKEMQDKLDAAEQSTKDMVAAVKAADTPLLILQQRYGELGNAIHSASNMMASFMAIQAKRDVVGVANNLSAAAGFGSDLFLQPSAPETVNGVFDYEAARRNENLMARQKQAMTNLRDETGATAEQAERLKAAIADMNASSTFDEVIEDGKNLMSVIIQVHATADKEQRETLEKWANNVSATMQVAQDQIDAEAAARNRLLDTYDKTSQEMIRLNDDLRLAEAERAKAVAAGLTEEAARWGDVVRGIRRTQDETRALAQQSDTAFKSMASAYQEYAASRMAGNAWAQSPSGFEAQYVAERASGAGSQNEELVRAVTATAEQLGIAAKDLLAVMSFETGGKLRPDVMGPTTKWGQHFGLIQFGQPQGAKYGVSPDSSITEQVIASGKYLQDAGVKAGDNLANIYAAVLAGDARKVNASDLAAGGVVGNVTGAVTGDQFAPHIARAEGMLKAWGGVVQEVSAGQKLLDAETKRALDLRTDFMASLDQQVRMAAMEAEATGKSVYEQTRLRAEMALTQDLRAKGIGLNERIAGTERTYGQAVQESADAMATAAQEQAAQEGRRQQAEEAARSSAEMMKRFQDDLTSGFTSAFQSVIDGTKSVSDAFKEMVAQMLAQRAAEQFSEGIGGLIGAAFGGGDPLTAALAGAGAPVARGGFMSGLGRLAAQAMHVTVGVDPDNGNITAFTQRQVSAGMRQADAMMPSRVTSITRDPLRR